jgi:lipoprotein-releasing system ATP-binding protein
MNNPILQLRDIYKSYNAGRPNEVNVLQGINLELAAGETCALMAPSGAGKSTLLHIAGLLDVPDRGSILLNGAEIAAKNDAQRTTLRRRDIGFVYQFHHLLPEFNAIENIVLPQLADGKTDRAARKRAGELLEMVGLSHRANNRPSQLSGGEQQRVAFCRALANNPQVLLADEPTGNLDQTTSDHVFDVLMQVVRDTGLTALIATHNPEMVKRMDRCVQLANRTLVAI